MKEKYRVVQRTKPKQSTEAHRLSGGNFKIGEWIEFQEIGRISKITETLGDSVQVVEVDIVSDTWMRERPAPPKIDKFQCQTCFDEFDHLWQFNDHWNYEHKPKRKPKAAKGGKDAKTVKTK